ncbi:MAG: hypothetical protein ACOYZ6_07330 [Chloroflexota bacterium]
MKNKTKLLTLLIVLSSAIFLVVSAVFTGLFLASSNSRDNQEPAKQQEMMTLVLEWGRLSPFPVSATNVSIISEGNLFTRSFRASFTAPKQDIESWVKDSLGLNEATPDELSDDKLQYIVTPGGGANRVEVMIDYGSNRVEIYVSWS